MNAIITAGRQIGQFAVQHSTTILTISAIGGVGATAVLTGRACVKASKLLEEQNYNSPSKPTVKEKAKIIVPQAVPPVLMGAATIACILGAHKIHIRNQAAIAAAYTMVNSKYEDYKQAVVKELGENKEQKISTAAAQDRINRAYGDGNGLNIIQTRFGNVLFMDDWSGRFFYSSYEAVQQAINSLTAKAQNHIAVSVNDFYEFLEIPPIGSGVKNGWNICDIADAYGDGTFAIPISTNNTCQTPTPEKLPCTLIEYDIEPLIDFDRNC